MRTLSSALILILGALALGACASPDVATDAPGNAPTAPRAPTAPDAPIAPTVPPPTDATAVPGEGRDPAPSVQPAPTGTWHAIRSNGARYVVHVREPEGGFQRGTSLEFDVRVAPASDPATTLTDVALALDADMPEHLHGINRVPRIERRADGTFRAENLYLHMPGWWELFFDVRQGPWTERAQLRVELE